MNSTIAAIPYNKLIFTDFEMASGQPTIEEGTPIFDLWRYKKRDKVTEELPSVEDTIKSYEKESALFANFGRIVSGVCGVVEKDTIRLKSFFGEEKDVVRDLTKTFVDANRIIVGWNQKNFDMVYLRKRHVITGLGMFPDKLTDVGLKPWEGKDLDLMQLWKSNSYYNDSLEEVCYFLNLPGSKDGEVKGSGVSKHFWGGGIEDIVKYNQKDVISTIAVFRAFRNEPQLTEIIYG